MPVAAIAAGAIGMGAGAAIGATTKVRPVTRDQASEFNTTLGAMGSAMPEEFGLQQQWAPQWQGLNLSNAYSGLFGANGQPGMLDLYGRATPVVGNITNAASSQRLGGMGTLFNQYGAPLTAAVRQANGNAGLLDTLNQQATADLNRGMSPAYTNEISQGVRAAQAGRGAFGMGNPAMSEEALFGAQGATNLLNQRRAFASGLTGLNTMNSGLPLFQDWSNAPAMSLTPGLMSQGQGTAPGLMFNPMNPYAQDVFSSNQNASMDANLANANIRMAMAGGLMGTGGQLMGAGLGRVGV